MDKLDLVRLVDPHCEEFEKISLPALQRMLAFDNTKPVKWATLISKTVPAMNKTGNPYFGKVFKIARTNVLINNHTNAYTTAVNNQRRREGTVADFLAAPRAWGTRLDNIPFVSHMTKSGDVKLYLEVFGRKNFREIFLDTHGNPLDANLVRPYIKESVQSSRQQTKKPIKLRDFSVENLIACVVNKRRYIIAP